MTKGKAKKLAFIKARQLKAQGLKVRVVFRSGICCEPGRGLVPFKGYEVQVL